MHSCTLGAERGEEVSTSSPTPTDRAETADTFALVDGFMATMIIFIEAGIILILLLLLLIVTVAACRMKKAQTKQVSLIVRTNDDDYALPTGKVDM